MRQLSLPFLTALQIGAITLAAAVLSSCGNDHQPILPNVSGKAGEIVVVMDKDNWDGVLGTGVRGLLASSCPYLDPAEPLYSLVNVNPSAFNDLFKIHRNIFIVTVNPQEDSCRIVLERNVWARPQCVVHISGKNSTELKEFLNIKSTTILNSFEQAERDRVIGNSIKYEEYKATASVKEVFGGSPRIPIGYKLRKISNDFAWITDEKQYSTQGIFVYRYAADSQEPFTMEAIIAKRNEWLKNNVPGMFENTWMTTSEGFPTALQYIRYKGRAIAELRGYWDVVNDFMGGPFVSHSFYSRDGKDIIVLEAWVYAPRYDKRQYLRQTEAILYSWEWADDSESKKENEK